MAAPTMVVPAPASDLLAIAEASVARYADRELFGEHGSGVWTWVTYGQWRERVDRARAGLAALGVAPGDRVAIISRNSAAWATAAYASYGLGAAFVPMYEAQGPAEAEHILRDCAASVVFCRTPEIAASVAAMQPRLPALRHLVVIEVADFDPRSMAALLRPAGGRDVAVRAVAPDDVATLIYTSGTTGVAKGVMLTHRNLASTVAATLAAFPIAPDDRTVSFLPWAHVFGQLGELHALIAAGASTAFNTDVTRLFDDLFDVRPTILVAVPRIFNRLHAAVLAELALRPRVLRAVFGRGLAASIRQRRGERIGVVDRVVRWLAAPLFARVRKRLGGRLRYAISGSATLLPEVAEQIDGLGIDVYEGYGLTETSPTVTMNRPGHRRFGSVGQPIAGVTVMIDTAHGETAGQGEIVVHGPNVMKGYHARPDEDARVFTADGGLRTGDLGRIDDAGYLYITGRIKEQYKLENGKYVMPGPLEERLALSPFIRNAMLYGADREFNVALVVIEPAEIRRWAADHHVALAADLTADAQVRALIQGELDREAAAFRPFERPRAALLTEEPLTVEAGLLTPTLKLRRRAVVARFGAALDALYPPRAAVLVSRDPAARVATPG
jgi:long-chain acyl-CoA synthetase